MLKVSYLLRSTSIPEIHEKENFEKKKFKDKVAKMFNFVIWL